MLQRHTNDVAMQASRRLQVFMQSHLRVAAIFSRRWATHENRDFSRKRFDEFISVILSELPGYHSVAIVPRNLGPGWKVDNKGRFSNEVSFPERHEILRSVLEKKKLVLSAPLKTGNGEAIFYAVLPLIRDDEFLGFLIVDFLASTLINDCFQSRIRSEFHFTIQDGTSLIFHSSPEKGDLSESSDIIISSIDFPVQNRHWRLVMTPYRLNTAASGWIETAAYPVFGLLLSIGLSLLVYLLSNRMEMYRRARDRALMEIEERKKAARALKISEQRYRNVFDSSTDGLLVLEPDGTVVEANPAAGRMHGFRSDEIINKPVQNLIASEHKGQYQEFRKQMEGSGNARLDSRDLHKNGNMIDVEVRGTRLKHDGMERYLAIITDVTDKRRAMERHALLSRKVLMAQEEERSRLSRELHDELGQLLTALRLEMGWIEKHMSRESSKEMQAFINTTQLVEKSTDELRRICRGLRPPLLDDLGLEPAIRLLVEEFQERTDIAVNCDIVLDDSVAEIPPEISLCTYRILQESLTNVRRHSKAGAVDISIAASEKELKLTVYDDGTGFDMGGAEDPHGCGIEGMQERANLVSGNLSIRTVINQGTRVILTVPLQDEGKNDQSTAGG